MRQIISFDKQQSYELRKHDDSSSGNCTDPYSWKNVTASKRPKTRSQYDTRNNTFREYADENREQRGISKELLKQTSQTCKQCHRHFRNEKEITRHMEEHYELKFRCPAPDCGNMFKQFQHLKLHHLAKHTVPLRKVREKCCLRDWSKNCGICNTTRENEVTTVKRNLNSGCLKKTQEAINDQSTV